MVRALLSPLVLVVLLAVPIDLARAGSKETQAFREAFMAYDTTAMKALLAKEPKLVRDAPGPTRWTPLHAAVAARDVPMVRLLLRFGPDLEAGDSDGARPLHLAVRDDADSTEAIAAARREIQEALLAARARVSATDSWGATPLHWAGMHDDPEAARLLIEHGADVNVRSPKEGMTPLHAAADGGDTTIVRLLLERGADPGARDRSGRTPVDVARQADHPQVATLLEGAAHPR